MSAETLAEAFRNADVNSDEANARTALAWFAALLDNPDVFAAADDAVKDAMVEDGPDGHIDGHDIITRAAFDAIKEALR